MQSIPAHALIHTDLVVLNGVAFPIRSIHRDTHSITLTLVGVEADFAAIFHNHSLITVRSHRG